MKSLSIIAFILAAALASAARADTTAALDAKLTSPPLAGFPLIFDLTITNTTAPGDRPPSFWYGGGDGVYPSAHGFDVRITDAAGHTVYRLLQNAQNRAGSGAPHPIDKSLTFPAVADPLPPGQYTLFVLAEDGSGLPPMRSSTFMLTIREDAVALKLAAEPYAAAPTRIPPERFNEFVGVTYGFSPVVSEWLATVSKPDADAAAVRTAAIRLSTVHRLPAGGAAILKDAIALRQKQPVSPVAAEQGRIVSSLIQCASALGGDEGTDIVLALAQGNSSERLFALESLGNCPPGKRVDDALIALTKDADAGVVQSAMIALGVRGNPIALPFALDALKKNNLSSSRAAIRIITGLCDDPAARQIITDASTDSQSPLHAVSLALLTRIKLVEHEPATRP